MERIVGILLWTIVIVNLVVLIIALTDIWPNNSLTEYRFLIGISFITFGGFLRQRIKRKTKKQLLN